MGTHLRVLSESYLMNTNMIGFRQFSKIFVSALEGITLFTSVANLYNRMQKEYEKCLKPWHIAMVLIQ